MSSKIDFATIDARYGNTGTITLPAGRWLITATVNCLTDADGSYQTFLAWLNETKTFQGYRYANQNKEQSCFCWVALIDISTETSYTLTTSGDSVSMFNRQWTAIKL